MHLNSILLILIFLSAVLVILTGRWDKKNLFYIFKPLTTLLIILLCYLQEPQIPPVYQKLILAGLFFSLFGDIFLMLPKDYFLQGLISFFIAHIFYLLAFLKGVGWIINIYMVVGVLICYLTLMIRILPQGKLTLPILLYGAILALLLAQAGGRFIVFPQQSMLLALAGTILFALSDSFLAYNRFVERIAHEEILVLGGYFSAQVLIALSV